MFWFLLSIVDFVSIWIGRMAAGVIAIGIGIILFYFALEIIAVAIGSVVIGIRSWLYSGGPS